jgi:hypothetical protein
MTLDDCWIKAEQGFAMEEHGYRPSAIADMLEDAGLPVYGSEARAIHSVLWTTATPESPRAQLFLALDAATPDQVAEAGLDRFAALRDALFRKSVGQPQLVEYVARQTQTLPFDAFTLVREEKRCLLSFLGTQELTANLFGIEYQGVEVMPHREGISLVVDSLQGVWKLRERISVGKKYFDKAVSEDWARWSPALKRDFIAILDARPPVWADWIIPEVYLKAFPLAVKSADWREALAAELSRRGPKTYTDTLMQIIWESALERFELPAAQKSVG